MTPVQSTTLGMHLSYLLEGFAVPPSAQDPIITGLALDSRRVRTGDCFFALDGTREHGAHYALHAVTQGAVAVVADDSTPLATPVPTVRVPALGSQVGAIAARFFGEPSADLATIAVTGTNGKTTVAHLCAQVLGALGRRCGYIGTLGMGDIDTLASSGVTTPDPITLQGEMRRLVAAGYDHLALEASSHALAQARLSGTRVKVAIFTGLGHDHLDYHESLAAYALAKRKLFAHPGLAHVVLNADDPLSATILRTLAPDITVSTYSLQRASALPAAHQIGLYRAQYTVTGTQLEVIVNGQVITLASQLIGDFNVQNLLATLGALLALGIPLDEVVRGISAARPVAGRLEAFGGDGAVPYIYIDYAHSPDSLERVLTVLRGFSSAALVCVFGCGGNRDRSKRPLMGAIAERLADKVFITDDNPRDETPEAIVEDILRGMVRPQSAQVIHARQAAITAALASAARGDVVLIAGKGHEAEQEIAGRKFPLSDQKIVQAWLATRA